MGFHGYREYTPTDLNGREYYTSRLLKDDSRGRQGKFFSASLLPNIVSAAAPFQVFSKCHGFSAFREPTSYLSCPKLVRVLRTQFSVVRHGKSRSFASVQTPILLPKILN
jgi:hypothetical protein